MQEDAAEKKDSFYEQNEESDSGLDSDYKEKVDEMYERIGEIEKELEEQKVLYKTKLEDVENLVNEVYELIPEEVNGEKFDKEKFEEVIRKADCDHNISWKGSSKRSGKCTKCDKGITNS